MKNFENTALLAHKRRIDAQRKQAAIARKAAEKQAQGKANIAAMHKVAGK